MELAITATDDPAGDMPTFLPLSCARLVIGEPAGTTNCTSAGWVAAKILIGTPSAAVLNTPASGAPKAKSIDPDAKAFIGALTSGKCTNSASIPRLARKSRLSNTAP